MPPVALTLSLINFNWPTHINSRDFRAQIPLNPASGEAKWGANLASYKRASNIDLPAPKQGIYKVHRESETGMDQHVTGSRAYDAQDFQYRKGKFGNPRKGYKI